MADEYKYVKYESFDDGTIVRILLENGVMQHMTDIEAIHTYEGTESMQALLIGRDITGMSAFA